MKKNTKNVAFKQDIVTHDKIYYIAKYEGRTLNGQIQYLIQKCIREFEKENGTITVEDLENVHS